MATITFTVPDGSVPLGAICRGYQAENSQYIGEAVSDGTNQITMQIPDTWFMAILLRVFPDDASGEVNPYPSKIVIE